MSDGPPHNGAEPAEPDEARLYREIIAELQQHGRTTRRRDIEAAITKTIADDNAVDRYRSPRRSGSPYALADRCIICAIQLSEAANVESYFLGFGRGNRADCRNGAAGRRLNFSLVTRQRCVGEDRTGGP